MPVANTHTKWFKQAYPHSHSERSVRVQAQGTHPLCCRAACFLGCAVVAHRMPCACVGVVCIVCTCVCVWLVAFASEITGTEAQAGLMPSLKIRLVTPSYQQGGDVHRLSTSEPISTFK